MSAANQMSSADAAWLHMDQPTNLMVVTSALWFEESPDWDRVREILDERMVNRFPRFRQRVVEGRQPLSGPHWEDDPDFNIDNHLHRMELEPPGDPAQLQALVGEMMARPLDPARPLWRFELVDGYGDGAAMVGRIHHCIADGVALARVLLSLTDDAPDLAVAPPREAGSGLPDSLPGPVAGAIGAIRDAAGALAHEAVEIVRHPEELLDLASSSREDAEALIKLLRPGADPQTPFKGELGVAQRVAWTAPIPLDAVREVGHAAGSTVNDVVLTAIAGTLRTYLERRGALVDELTAIVPFNLRPPDEPLPAELGNRFGLVYMPLPLAIENRRRRLGEIHRRMDEIKHSPEGAVSYGVLGALGRAPAQVEHLLVDQFTTRGTAVMTNIPGPPDPVYLAGVPVHGVLVWAPRSGGVSMSFSIFSYAGAITIGVAADAGLVPDPERIVAGIERELEALLRREPAERG